MNKLMMVVGALALAGCVTGCAALKEMQEKAEREEAARKAEMSEKGPVRYFLDHKANAAALNKAKQSKAFDRDFEPALSYCVASFVAEAEELQRFAVVQDGVAVWEQARAAHSEKIQKELESFTAEDDRAAYVALAEAAKAADATDDAKKRFEDVNAYFTWGAQLGEQAELAARKRNEEFVNAIAIYTAKAKRIAEKFKKDKLKYATAVADGLSVVNYLSLAGEASSLEAEVLRAGRGMSEQVKGIDIQ